MDAAREVFGRKGYAKTTVAEITDAAGAAKGTFYLYFRSKDDLIAALRDEFLHDFLARVAQKTGAAARHGWEKQVDVFIDLFMDSVLSNPELHEVFFHSGSRRETSLALDHSPVIQWLTNFIRAGIGAKTMDVRTPEVTAVLLFAASHQAVDLVMQGPAARRAAIRSSLATLFHRTLTSSSGVGSRASRGKTHRSVDAPASRAK